MAESLQTSEPLSAEVDPSQDSNVSPGEIASTVQHVSDVTAGLADVMSSVLSNLEIVPIEKGEVSPILVRDTPLSGEQIISDSQQTPSAEQSVTIPVSVLHEFTDAVVAASAVLQPLVERIEQLTHYVGSVNGQLASCGCEGEFSGYGQQNAYQDPYYYDPTFSFAGTGTTDVTAILETSDQNYDGVVAKDEISSLLPKTVSVTTTPADSDGNSTAIIDFVVESPHGTVTSEYSRILALTDAEAEAFRADVAAVDPDSDGVVTAEHLFAAIDKDGSNAVDLPELEHVSTGESVSKTWIGDIASFASYEIGAVAEAEAYTAELEMLLAETQPDAAEWTNPDWWYPADEWSYDASLSEPEGAALPVAETIGHLIPAAITTEDELQAATTPQAASSAPLPPDATAVVPASVTAVNDFAVEEGAEVVVPETEGDVDLDEIAGLTVSAIEDDWAIFGIDC